MAVMEAELLREVNRYLRANDMPRTKFGRLAVNDPRLVDDLTNGRTLRAATRQRVVTFLRAPAEQARA